MNALTSNTSSFSIVMHCTKWCPVLPKWRMSCTLGAWADQRGTKCSLLFTHFPNDALLILEILPLLFLFFRPLSVRAGLGQRTDRAGDELTRSDTLCPIGWKADHHAVLSRDHSGFRSNVKHILALGLAAQHASPAPGQTLGRTLLCSRKPNPCVQVARLG